MNIVVDMKDLIRFTPTSHQDYDMLQKTLRLGQDFLENFKNPGKQDTVRTFSLYSFDTSIYYFFFLWLAILWFFYCDNCHVCFSWRIIATLSNSLQLSRK
jgi:hypothetical protein